jgi:hypothetical protein
MSEKRFIFASRPRSRNALLAACAILILCIGVVAFADQLAEVTAGPTGIQVSAAMPNVTSIALRVVDPNGELVFDERSDGAPIQWAPPAGASDGLYSYEVRAGNEKKKEKRTESQQPALKTRSWTKSGTVLIQHGAIMPATGKESSIMRGISSAIKAAWAGFTDFLVPSAYADQVINDDLIITSHGCIGYDCLTDGSESFAENLKLKTNSNQLLFDDTSTLAGFPANDWRLIANDADSGGASYFAIEDSTAGTKPFTVSAGAPANSIFVNSSGRIGLGTSTPGYDIHVFSNDTPGLRMEQSGVSWPAYTWDVGSNEYAFFVRDITGGSKYPFRIKPGTPSDTLYLSETGKIGIGHSNPLYVFHVKTTDNNLGAFENTAGPDAWFWMANNAVTGGLNTVGVGSIGDDLRFRAGDSERVRVKNNGNVGIGVTSPTHKLQIAGGAYCDGGAWVSGSSRETKENIKELSLDEARDALEGLKPVKFNYRFNKEEDYMGFIAEDVPQIVATKDRKGIADMDVVAVLTKVVKEQQKSINEQRETIAELKEKISKLYTP